MENSAGRDEIFSYFERKLIRRDKGKKERQIFLNKEGRVQESRKSRSIPSELRKTRRSKGPPTKGQKGKRIFGTVLESLRNDCGDPAL